MKHHKFKVSKIVDELMTFCFSIGATDINVNVKETHDRFEIHLKSNYQSNTPRQKINELCKLLECGRREEMEGYYWYLAGDSDVDTELSLIGMMTDSCRINFHEGEDIDITLYRSK